MGGTKTPQPQSSDWWWRVSAGLRGYPVGVVYAGGPRRWGIENKACTELTQFYHLEHCYPHEPVALLAQRLILLLGFVLFSAYARLYSQRVRLGQVSLGSGFGRSRALGAVVRQRVSPSLGAVLSGLCSLARGRHKQGGAGTPGEGSSRQGGGRPPFKAIALDHREKTGRSAKTPGVNPTLRNCWDAVQALARKEFNQNIERFVVSGASKRGWTTWLSAAVDPRVQAIAPRVIDMLNLKAQTQWAQKVYGAQSDRIRAYTELHLIERMDDPRMVELRGRVDPYSYRARYAMPKLLLLGTNDPYWTVDSVHNYWDDLSEPKLVFQTPNAGHDLAGGRDCRA